MKPERAIPESTEKSVNKPIRRKRNADIVEELLDTAIEDSMAASDPPTISNSQVIAVQRSRVK